MDAHYLVEMAYLAVRLEAGDRMTHRERHELERYLAELERAAAVAVHVEGLRRLTEDELSFGE